LGKTLAQLITNVRALSNTQKSKFVTDDELGDYVNRAVRVLYDLITAADESYYNATQDITFGNQNEAAASMPLPPDFAKVRGVTQFPDSLQASPVYAKTFTNHQIGALGYLMDGNNISLAPFQLASTGNPFRLTYVQKPPQFGPAVNIVSTNASASADNVVQATALWTFANGNFNASLVGATLIVAGCVQLFNNGSFPILTVPSSTTLTTAPTAGGPGTEMFSPGVSASIALPGIFPTYPAVSPYQAASMTQLDVTLDNFDDFISTWVAVRVCEKKKDSESVQNLVPLLNSITERVNAMAPDRSAEPQAAPVLWSPSLWPYRGVFPYSPGNGQ
jgi:hypothetical protein